MSKTITYSSNGIYSSGGSSEDPICFNDIYEYFLANPLTENDVGKYELNNIANWSGLNGMSSLSSDDGGFKSTVESLPIERNVSQALNGSGAAGQINYYTPKASSFFSNYDFFIVKGTANLDNLCWISTNNTAQTNYVRGFVRYPQRDVGSETGLSGVTVRKPLMLSEYSLKHIGTFDTLRFKLKTDSSTAKLCGVILKNGASNLECGASKILDVSLGADWTQYSLTIKDLDLIWGSQQRGYWRTNYYVSFALDDISIGESIWIKDAELVQENINPVKTGANSFQFYTGLIIGADTYFKDKNFSVRFNCLDSTRPHTTSDSLIYINGTSDYVELGDYSGGTYYGGVIEINNFCFEDLGSLYFNNVNFQSITLMGVFDTLSTVGVLSGNVKCRNSNFLSPLDGKLTGYIENSSITGGRYLVWSDLSYLDSNNYTIYSAHPILGCNTTIWWSSSKSNYSYEDIISCKNIKIIDSRDRTFIYHRSYEVEDNKTRYFRYANLDMSEAGTTRAYYKWYFFGGHINRGTEVYISFTLDIDVIDSYGNLIEDCKVTIYNHIGIQFEKYTDSSGNLSDYVDVLRATGESTDKYFNFRDTGGWTEHYKSIKLKIEKVGYRTFETLLLKEYDINSPIVKSGYSNYIMLEVPELLISAVTITDCTAIGASDGQLEITAEGGDTNYTYSINGVDYQASNTFSGLSAGDYTVYVKDGEDTMASFDITISHPKYEKPYSITMLKQSQHIAKVKITQGNIPSYVKVKTN